MPIGNFVSSSSNMMQAQMNSQTNSQLKNVSTPLYFSNGWEEIGISDQNKTYNSRRRHNVDYTADVSSYFDGERDKVMQELSTNLLFSNAGLLFRSTLYIKIQANGEMGLKTQEKKEDDQKVSSLTQGPTQEKMLSEDISKYEGTERGPSRRAQLEGDHRFSFNA